MQSEVREVFTELKSQGVDDEIKMCHYRWLPREDALVKPIDSSNDLLINT